MTIKTITVENNWLTRGFIDFGWGNGYVLIPKGHPLHGKHYDDIDVDVHGGLTFSEMVDEQLMEAWNDNDVAITPDDMGMWIVGFDTAHSGDTLEKWPKEKVEEEAMRLKDQIINYPIL